MDWLSDDEVVEGVLLERVTGFVDWLLLVGVKDQVGEVEEEVALHWAV